MKGTPSAQLPTQLWQGTCMLHSCNPAQQLNGSSKVLDAYREGRFCATLKHYRRQYGASTLSHIGGF